MIFCIDGSHYLYGKYYRILGSRDTAESIWNFNYTQQCTFVRIIRTILCRIVGPNCMTRSSSTLAYGTYAYMQSSNVQFAFDQT